MAIGKWHGCKHCGLPVVNRRQPRSNREKKTRTHTDSRLTTEVQRQRAKWTSSACVCARNRVKSKQTSQPSSGRANARYLDACGGRGRTGRKKIQLWKKRERHTHEKKTERKAEEMGPTAHKVTQTIIYMHFERKKGKITFFESSIAETQSNACMHVLRMAHRRNILWWNSIGYIISPETVFALILNIIPIFKCAFKRKSIYIYRLYKCEG